MESAVVVAAERGSAFVDAEVVNAFVCVGVVIAFVVGGWLWRNGFLCWGS